MKLSNIEVSKTHKHLQIKELTDEGVIHRRIITPDMDVSSEVQEIQDKAEEVWTDDVKSGWATFQAEEDAKINPE